MLDLLHVTKALSDKSRLRVLYALSRRELCVCQLIELLGLAPSTVSKHMAILRHARLVEDRKEGRWVYYRLADNHAPKELREAISWVNRWAGRTPTVREDTKRLKGILRMDLEKLCKIQNKR